MQSKPNALDNYEGAYSARNQILKTTNIRTINISKIILSFKLSIDLLVSIDTLIVTKQDKIVIAIRLKNISLPINVSMLNSEMIKSMILEFDYSLESKKEKV